MKVYIAAPYKHGDNFINVRTAIRYANSLREEFRLVPFIPHMTAFWNFVFPHEEQFWLDYDMEWLEVCDAVLRLPGHSSGADGEVARAEELDIPVFYDMQSLLKFRERWMIEHPKK